MSVLASPGTPSKRQWPRASTGDEQLFDHILLTNHRFGQLFPHCRTRRSQAFSAVKVDVRFATARGFSRQIQLLAWLGLCLCGILL